ncbi:MAG: uroporphyrinogen-III C-methyltransferase [Woeseiaceae bacterium]|nr:uroporphyrinogen-III C-methyltransferase [Woeseiaceae bacterium]
MDYFPVFLKLNNKSVLLVGGGQVAARKARMLLDAGARLTIVTPETNAAVDALGKTRNVTIKRRRFRSSDIDGHWLVVSASNSPNVERDVALAAENARVFCNAVDDIANCSYITPAIVDRSPVVIAISSGGTAPVLARRIRTMIETQLPAALGDLAQLAARWRVKVAGTLTSFSSRLRFWEQVFDGRIAEAVYSGNSELGDELIAGLLDESAFGSESERGVAWLTGAGPGDPDLVTLKALRAMQSADVIVHDRLVSDRVLALARRDAERISVGKTPGCSKNSQAEINALLVKLVAEGKRVCRLKGGDPFIFGRGGEEAEALSEAGLPYIVIPGITAAAGCAASAGIPLTHRDASQSVVLLTGHGKDSIDKLDWDSLARDRQTLAVYMGVSRFPELMQKLTGHGRPLDTPVAIIERGTTPQERIVRGTLGQLPMLAKAHAIESPAILIIGEVARTEARSNQISNRDSRAERAYAEKSAIQRA